MRWTEKKENIKTNKGYLEPQHELRESPVKQKISTREAERKSTRCLNQSFLAINKTLVLLGFSYRVDKLTRQLLDLLDIY